MPTCSRCVPGLKIAILKKGNRNRIWKKYANKSGTKYYGNRLKIELKGCYKMEINSKVFAIHILTAYANKFLASYFSNLITKPLTVVLSSLKPKLLLWIWKLPLFYALSMCMPIYFYNWSTLHHLALETHLLMKWTTNTVPFLFPLHWQALTMYVVTLRACPSILSAASAI